jgi:hypothetical protein
MTNGNDYRGGLIRDADPWAVWQWSKHRGWLCVGGAQTEADAEQVRQQKSADEVLPRGQTPAYRYRRTLGAAS